MMNIRFLGERSMSLFYFQFYPVLISHIIPSCLKRKSIHIEGCGLVSMYPVVSRSSQVLGTCSLLASLKANFSETRSYIAIIGRYPTL